LCKKHETNAYYQRFLALTDHHLGVVEKNEGNVREAKERYLTALDWQEKLVNNFPSVPYYQRDQALAYQDLGILLMETGIVRETEATPRPIVGQTASATSDTAAASSPRDTALKALQEAKAIRQKLFDRFNGAREYKQELAHSHSNLGALFTD